MTMHDDRGASAHLDDARCADLVLGLTDDATREAALAHVASCPGCALRLRAHASASERARADWRSRGAATPPVATVTLLPARPRSSLHRAVTGALAAAAVVAIAFAVPLLRSRSGPSEEARWLPAPGDIVESREGTVLDPRLASGLEAYARRDLAVAERDLGAARASGPAAHVRALYLAQVRLARGNAAGAVELLRGVSWLDVPEPWRREGTLLLARALRADGSGSAADTIERALRSLDSEVPFTP